MAKSRNPWQTVSIHPLIGPLDTRSRPADIPPGGFRWKQNFQVNSEGKLCRRSGHNRFFSDYLYDNAGILLTDPSHGSGSHYHNHDLHHQGADPREPITFLFESTSSDGTRRLFSGTQSRLYVLNSDTGQWATILSGGNIGSSGTRWHAAELQNKVVFVNNFNAPQVIDITTPFTPGSTGNIPGLNSPIAMTKARFVIEFEGFMMLMNVVEQGTTYTSRIRWSDINDTMFWTPDPAVNNGATSLAGFQDLDYGDEILAAAPMLDALFVYTRRSIWKVQVAPSGQNGVFSFTRVYTEPKNQAGCLAFPNTLVSTGSEHWYMSGDGIYNFNPYIPAPERQDWLHQADGVIYRKPDTAMDLSFCPSPVAEYLPDQRELWFSWPSIGQKGRNNLTLVAQIEKKTADVVDTGYMVLCNFRRTPANANECNETQDLIGASNVDWCLKSLGGVFYREFADLDPSGDITKDLILVDETYHTVGYTSILRGLIPTGLFDRDKRIRSLLIEHDTSDQDVPCQVNVRIGNAKFNVDVNDFDDHCAPLWNVITPKLLQCPDTAKLPALKAKNLRPNLNMDFPLYQEGTYLYYEITITNQDGSPAIGADTCWMLLNFSVMALPLA